MTGPVKAKKNELVLYFGHGSFYSERARFGLVEKELAFTERFINMGSWEHLQPWYLRINPAGTVPTLQHGDKFIPDSLVILRYLDDTFGEPRLQPDPRTAFGKKVEELAKKLDSIDIPQLTFGTMRHPDLAIDCKIPSFIRSKFLGLSDNVINAVKKLREQHPDMKDVYDSKLSNTQSRQNKTVDRCLVEAEIKRASEILQEIEQLLAQTKEANHKRETWIFGEAFTVADIMLAIILARFNGLGLSKVLFLEGKLPLVDDYYQRLHNRKSFRDICLTNPMGKIKPRLPQWCRAPKFTPVTVGVIGGVAAVAYWFLRK